MLLLTGATGLLGRELLDRLRAARPDRRIVALTRRQEKAAELSRISGLTALEADLMRPGLGLDGVTLQHLRNSVTEILHCAAETRFGLPIEEARAANVGSTENLLQVARGCRRLQKFGHVSTVYVAGRAAGRVPEAPFRHSDGFLNTYQQSKYEAEELVIRAMSDLPLAVFRLSSVIGDSATGQVRQFNHVHQLLRVLPRNVLAVAPCDPAAPIDLIPSDWASSSLACLFDSRFVPGRIYQLCAGQQASLTAGQMIDLTAGIFQKHPVGRRLSPLRLPKLVSLVEYEEYVARMRRGTDRLLNELLRVLGYFLPHLGIFQVFENRHASEALAGSGLTLPPIRSYYHKIVHYCLETDWGRTAPAAVPKL
ncbi:MAG TPA: SDR family oxidoreductase [Bryobacterales bacterium]|nr:SDR family oxidoreductase [Bryobacterales bacterium]